MHIEYSQEGGIAHFPGLAKPVRIDSAQLSEAEVAELRHLVEDARLFELPEKADTPPRGAADFVQYTIAIEDGPRHHTVRFTDLADNPALKRLLGFLKALPAGQGR
jgi:hypothetical protein